MLYGALMTNKRWIIIQDDIGTKIQMALYEEIIADWWRSENKSQKCDFTEACLFFELETITHNNAHKIALQ